MYIAANAAAQNASIPISHRRILAAMSGLTARRYSGFIANEEACASSQRCSRGQDEPDRREQQKPDDERDRHEQRRLNRENHHQPARAGEGQILRVVLRPIARQTVMALVHAEVGERRQQEGHAEEDVPGGLESGQRAAPQVRELVGKADAAIQRKGATTSAAIHIAVEKGTARTATAKADHPMAALTARSVQKIHGRGACRSATSP